MASSPLAVRLRERPPLNLSINVETPNGAVYRLGRDDPNPANAPEALTFGDAMPGGFERCDFTLQRDPRLAYPDLQELSKITVRGLGGAAVAWQGRLEKLPDTAGSQAQVTPEAFGYQAALEDDNSAREIYVDRELSRWQGAAIQRKINRLNEGGSLVDATVAADASTGLPSVITALTGPWALPTLAEGWYDGHGIPLGLIAYAWMLQASNKIGDTDATNATYGWDWEVGAAADDVPTSYGGTGNLKGTGPMGFGTFAVPSGKPWGRVLLFAQGGLGTSGVEYPVFWPVLAVYGCHGLTLHPESGTATEAPGLLASDVVGHALNHWAPELAFTMGAEGTIQPSSFIIPQLAFLEPTTVAEIIKQATRFELQDWAVWEGPRIYINERGARGKKWRARVGPATLQDAGPQIARLWNGVVVAYQDVTGKMRLVGPEVPGAPAGTSFAGAESGSENASLYDADPENPLNKQKIKKWALLKMGTSTQAGAIQVGAIFLREQSLLESSGSASLTGHVEDSSGVLWPAWMVRSGDQISFVDSRNPGYRRIVKTEYADTTKTRTIQLDQPPEAMQALLERLSVVLAPLGLS
jgi:hypothetical protein